MSLDVYLTMPGELRKWEQKPIFTNDNGHDRELMPREWDRLFGNRRRLTFEEVEQRELYSSNITHNLGKMADAAGIYEALWRPDENGLTKAKQLIEPLRAGLARLEADPNKFEAFNSPNGWGLYEHFVPWVRAYLSACEEYPEADVSVSR